MNTSNLGKERIGKRKNKAVMLDRDGVINVDCGYVHEIKNFEFIPEVLDALQELAKTEFKIIIITGQSGIGRGYYTEEDYQKLTKHMLKEFEKNSIRIDGIYYCPHSPGYGCSCRKPETGMVEKAKKDFNIDLKKSYFIGDKTSDIKCGKNAGCRTILVRTGKAGKDKRYDVRPDFVADDLYRAIKWILNQEK